MTINPPQITYTRNTTGTISGGSGFVSSTQNTSLISDPYCSDDLKLNFALYDPKTGIQQASEAHGLVTYDSLVTSGPTDDAGFQLLMLLLLLNNNPDNALFSDPDTYNDIQLMEGYNSIEAVGAYSIGLFLNAGLDTVDKWYGSSDFGNYGWMCHGRKEDGAFPPLMPPTFINLPVCTMALPIGNYNGFTVFLKKGISGTAITSKRLRGSKDSVFQIVNGAGGPLNTATFIPPGPG